MADLIDRRALTDYIKAQRERLFVGYTLEEAILMMISEVPSAQPERKKGKWIDTDRGESNISKVYCSICMKEYIPRHWMSWKYGETPKNFCPNCGAEMEGEE